VGWTFWRCWASEWEADREGVFADLVRVLELHGIAPIGAASPSNTALVEFRSVGRSYPVANTGCEENITVGQTEEVNTKSGSDEERPTSATGVTRSTGLAEQSVFSFSDRRVAIGDAVQVRFADGEARTLTVHIVGDGPIDGRQRIAPSSPLGSAILGLRTEDETEVVIDGKPRTVIIEAIRAAA